MILINIMKNLIKKIKNKIEIYKVNKRHNDIIKDIKKGRVFEVNSKNFDKHFPLP